MNHIRLLNLSNGTHNLLLISRVNSSLKMAIIESDVLYW